MTPAARTRRLRLRAALAAALPIAAAVLVHHTRLGLRQTIARADQLRTAATVESATLESLTRLAAQAERLTQHQRLLAGQRADLAQPALVVAELAAACRAVGAAVEAVRPVEAPVAAGTAAELTAAARYRVTVCADFATLGQLLDTFPRQRLPVRVTDFCISAPESPAAEPFAPLRAEITLESFVPRAAAPNGGTP